jgi:hypothetical protein
MTPEELERLQSCTPEIAKILYNNTPPSELTSLENIEKHLRQQWLGASRFCAFEHQTDIDPLR